MDAMLRNASQALRAFDHSIFLNITALLIIAAVLKPSSLLYLPSMKSIRCL
jgi:hypothetical protein